MTREGIDEREPLRLRAAIVTVLTVLVDALVPEERWLGQILVGEEFGQLREMAIYAVAGAIAVELGRARVVSPATAARAARAGAPRC